MAKTYHLTVSPLWQRGKRGISETVAADYVADRPRYRYHLDEQHYTAIRDSYLPVDTFLYQLAISPLFSPYDQSILSQGKDSQRVYYLDRTSYLNRIITDLQPCGLTLNIWKTYFTELYRDNPETFGAILSGINYYLERDYFASCYILIFQTEEYLRLFAQRHQQSTTELTRHGLEYQPIGRLLPQLSDYLPSSLLGYASWILIDRQGLNLRNRAAHGLLKQGDITAVAPTTLIHLLTILHRLYQLSR